MAANLRKRVFPLGVRVQVFGARHFRTQARVCQKAEDVRDQFKKTAETKTVVLEKVSNLLRSGIAPAESQKLYDMWQEDYDKEMSLLSYNEPEYVADTLVDYLGDNKGADIVDACAGTGRVGRRLKERGFLNLTAMDGNANMLEVAKKKKIYKSFITAWMSNAKLPIPDDRFDALTTAGSFYEGHLKPDCLLETIRIVKPGGYIVIGVPEINLITVDALRDKLEPTMKFYEDKGLWKMVLRKVVSKFGEGTDLGVLFCFQLQQGKCIINGQ